MIIQFANKLASAPLILAGLIVGLCLPAQAEEPTVVALFGDSTSLGFNQSFPVSDRNGRSRLNYGQPSIQLTSLLNNSRRPSLVPNLGRGGTASGPSMLEGFQGNVNGVDRITSDLSDLRANLDGRAYYVLIMYGVNDPAFGIPSSITGFNNNLMIQRADAQGFTTLVSTILPCDVCTNNVNTINSAIFNAFQQRSNAGADVHFVDNHAVVRPDWTSSLSDPDGIHPNDAGYSLVANNWFDTQLERLIEQDGITIAPIIDLLLD